MQNKALLSVQKGVCCVILGSLCLFSALGTVSAHAQSVYDNQAPMTDTELVTFIKLLPQFRAWATTHQDESHPSIIDDKADFTYSEAAAQWVKTHGFEPRRFFSVMGKAAAALFLVSEGLGPDSSKPKDMPAVSQSELDLVQKHLAQLLEAGSNAPPL